MLLGGQSKFGSTVHNLDPLYMVWSHFVSVGQYSQDLEKIGIVLCNSMKVTEDIDDFLKNEHHRLDVIRCVKENDMKAERRLHSSLVEQYNNRTEWI
jgi:hypothetical protein